MKQDPYPPDDVVLEKFCDWLWAWRNGDKDSPGMNSPEFWRAGMDENDLRRAWLCGVAEWYRSQCDRPLPIEQYRHACVELRKVLEQLEGMPKFRPFSCML